MPVIMSYILLMLNLFCVLFVIRYSFLNIYTEFYAFFFISYLVIIIIMCLGCFFFIHIQIRKDFVYLCWFFLLLYAIVCLFYTRFNVDVLHAFGEWWCEASYEMGSHTKRIPTVWNILKYHTTLGVFRMRVFSFNKEMVEVSPDKPFWTPLMWL